MRETITEEETDQVQINQDDLADDCFFSRKKTPSTRGSWGLEQKRENDGMTQNKGPAREKKRERERDVW